jgi:primosomal replication protein N
VLNQPELRTAPGGMALLRFAVECGGEGEELRIEVVMIGEQAREAARGLRAGQQIKVAGRLRPVAPAIGTRTRQIEVLANEIKPAGD